MYTMPHFVSEHYDLDTSKYRGISIIFPRYIPLVKE